MLLSVHDLHAGYGRTPVLHGASLSVAQGEIVSILGVNGAGKTTTLRTISGLIRPSLGAITLNGSSLAGVAADARARLGLGHVPEGRGVLGTLTVLENLKLGSAARRPDAPPLAEDLDWVFRLFPQLAEKRRALAGSLSGGQQQMLAIGRALIGRPTLLMVDELSLGLAPAIVDQLFTVIVDLRTQGHTFLLVEQNADVLDVSDRTYVMAEGKTVLEARSRDLAGSERDKLARIYVGRDS